MKHSIIIERTDHNGAENQCPFHAQTWVLRIGDYREPRTMTHIFKFVHTPGLLSDLLHKAYIESKRRETKMIQEMQDEDRQH